MLCVNNKHVQVYTEDWSFIDTAVLADKSKFTFTFNFMVFD